MGQVAGQLQTETDEIVIAGFLSVSNVAPYNAARKLSGIGQMLTAEFMKVIVPLASELQAGSDSARLRLLYITSTRTTLAIFLPVACTIILLAQPLLLAWVGPAFVNSADILVILTLAGLVDSLLWPIGSIFPALGRHRPVAINAVVGALVNLFLSIVLVQRYGVIGVAFGTLIATSVECFAFALPYAMRVIGVRLSVAFKQIFMPTLAPVVPMAMIILALRQAIQPSSFPTIIVVA